MKSLFVFSLFIFFLSVRAIPIWPHDTQRKVYILLKPLMMILVI